MWGDTMDYYVEEKKMELGPCWVWKDFSNLQLFEEHKLRLEGIFKEILIILSNEEDRIVWCASKSGCYST